jgi:Protein of unknown function (DUF998)
MTTLDRSRTSATSPSDPAAGTPRTTALLACGAVAGPLFTLAWLVEGATRADYDPLRHPVSSLAIGELGWIQRTTFVVTGLLMLAFTVGLRGALQPRGGSRWGRLLVGAFAIGLIGAGLFVTGPLSGYPTGTPGRPLERSAAGILHDLFGVPVFLGLPAACFVFARRFAQWGERGWAVYSAATGIVFAAGFVLTSAAFGQAERLVAFGGLLQRTTLSVGWTWLTLLALHLAQQRPHATRQPNA